NSAKSERIVRYHKSRSVKKEPELPSVISSFVTWALRSVALKYDGVSQRFKCTAIVLAVCRKNVCSASPHSCSGMTSVTAVATAPSKPKNCELHNGTSLSRRLYAGHIVPPVHIHPFPWSAIGLSCANTGLSIATISFNCFVSPHLRFISTNDCKPPI